MSIHGPEMVNSYVSLPEGKSKQNRQHDPMHMFVFFNYQYLVNSLKNSGQLG